MFRYVLNHVTITAAASPRGAETVQLVPRRMPPSRLLNATPCAAVPLRHVVVPGRAPAALIVPSERLTDLLTALPIALSVSQEVATDILLQVTTLRGKQHEP